MKITFNEDAYKKICAFTDLASGEISGIAKAIPNEDFTEFHVEDAIIFKQTCSAARTVLDDQAQALFLDEIMSRGESPELWNVWWHSHVNMGVFWSSTDTSTMDNHSNQPYLISIVTNKRREFKCRVDWWFNSEIKKIKKSELPDFHQKYITVKELGETIEKVREHYFLDNITVEKPRQLNDDTFEACKAEFESKVSNETSYPSIYKPMGNVKNHNYKEYNSKDDDIYDDVYTKPHYEWERDSFNERLDKVGDGLLPEPTEEFSEYMKLEDDDDKIDFLLDRVGDDNYGMMMADLFIFDNERYQQDAVDLARTNKDLGYWMFGVDYVPYKNKDKDDNMEIDFTHKGRKNRHKQGKKNK